MVAILESTYLDVCLRLEFKTLNRWASVGGRGGTRPPFRYSSVMKDHFGSWTLPPQAEVDNKKKDWENLSKAKSYSSSNIKQVHDDSNDPVWIGLRDHCTLSRCSFGSSL